MSLWINSRALYRYFGLLFMAIFALSFVACSHDGQENKKAAQFIPEDYKKADSLYQQAYVSFFKTDFSEDSLSAIPVLERFQVACNAQSVEACMFGANLMRILTLTQGDYKGLKSPEQLDELGRVAAKKQCDDGKKYDNVSLCVWDSIVNAKDENTSFDELQKLCDADVAQACLMLARFLEPKAINAAALAKAQDSKQESKELQRVSALYDKALLLDNESCKLDQYGSCKLSALFYEMGSLGNAPDSLKARAFWQHSCKLGDEISCVLLQANEDKIRGKDSESSASKEDFKEG